ncbi:MAG: ketopantoate reductase family protein, partial [Actinobacteria bacterium]|nr:ketopantoate reductase family protein [Actinomycetota bacterium]
MRFIVYGLGAIGGAVAAHLVLAGAEVAGVARGAHFEKIRADGLRLDTPSGSTSVRFPVTEDPAELRPGPDDLVIMAVKSQDTAGALTALAAASRDVAVACFQNGVANERAAARYFDRVYGVVVMCPATHLEPGVVAVHSAKVPALFDIGRSPSGLDERAEALAGTLAAAGCDARAVSDVMRWKHTKLLRNLGNAAEALTGVDSRSGRVVALAFEEGMACLEAAGVSFASVEED